MYTVVDVELDVDEVLGVLSPPQLDVLAGLVFGDVEVAGLLVHHLERNTAALFTDLGLLTGARSPTGLGRAVASAWLWPAATGRR